VKSTSNEALHCVVNNQVNNYIRHFKSERAAS